MSMLLRQFGFATMLTLAVAGYAHAQQNFSGIGRAATPAEIKAWDIDVRPDFKGLPPGSGSVAKGQQVWETKCESCHGTFGESNDVFTPIAGGTTKEDMAKGRVATLSRADFPQRTTMMKLSQVSTLWDYINRAMPWNAPKTLSTEEVYAVTAYVLHLGDVLPADFVLSDRNIRDVQAKLPNRNGMAKFEPLWNLSGKGDVTGELCMRDCKPEVRVTSSLPDFARNQHGNLAAQSRLIGPFRGTNTAMTPAEPKSNATPSNANAGAHADGAALAKTHNCMACHAPASKLVGPSNAEIAAKYKDDAGAEARLMAKVKAGGSGVWGVIPMPAHPNLSEDDLRTLIRWNLSHGL
jgi:S-disulfanyl-L-cysteine oxidoreductase SoxD